VGQSIGHGWPCSKKSTAGRFRGILADGVERAAKRIGRGAEACAIHVHGQERAFMTRASFRCAGWYLVNAHPARHMNLNGLHQTEGEEGLLRIRTSEPAGDEETEKRGRIHALASSYSQAFSNSGMCLFATERRKHDSAGRIDLSPQQAGTSGRRRGDQCGQSESPPCSKRSMIREGLTARDFVLPPRLTQGPATAHQRRP